MSSDSFGSDPWIETLRTYLLTRYERGDKLLGVCFGHQLLALLLGGKSERATQGWGRQANGQQQDEQRFFHGRPSSCGGRAGRLPSSAQSE